jgi:hypothetical protein
VSENASEELDILHRGNTTYLRTGVRNCRLRENKYAIYTERAWSVHRVSLGDGCGSVSVMTVSKQYV